MLKNEPFKEPAPPLDRIQHSCNAQRGPARVIVIPHGNCGCISLKTYSFVRFHTRSGPFFAVIPVSVCPKGIMYDNINQAALSKLKAE